MFSAGDTVSYGNTGICKIKEITEMELGKVKKQYYVLVPVNDEKSTVFVPCDSDKLLQNMRRVLSAEEIDKLIDSAAASPMEWINDDIERKEHCSTVLKSGDRSELMRLIEMLYLRREELKFSKKHFHISDERYLREAERLLHDEFSFILGIKKDEVPGYILNRIKK